MKHTVKTYILSLLLFILCGCSNSSYENSRNPANGENFAGKVIREQSRNNSQIQNRDPASESFGADEGNPTEALMGRSESDPVGADCDLIAMGSDMAYAAVYQMMADPDAYIGKTIRIQGLYFSGYYEPTGRYYYYCMIQDTLACCAQGLEFVWADVPDEYPDQNAAVVVQGVFESYQEDGDEYRYCRLRDAVLETID